MSYGKNLPWKVRVNLKDCGSCYYLSLPIGLCIPHFIPWDDKEMMKEFGEAKCNYFPERIIVSTPCFEDYCSCSMFDNLDIKEASKWVKRKEKDVIPFHEGCTCYTTGRKKIGEMNPRGYCSNFVCCAWEEGKLYIWTITGKKEVSEEDWGEGRKV